jgi:hypothetical protein
VRRAASRRERDHERIPRGHRRRPPGKLRAAADARYRRPAKPANKDDAIGSALAAVEAKRVVEVWPENYAAWAFFLSIDGQWRCGPGGFYALDYMVMHRELDDLGLIGEERELMKADLQVLEGAALKAMQAD